MHTSDRQTKTETDSQTDRQTDEDREGQREGESILYYKGYRFGYVDSFFLFFFFFTNLSLMTDPATHTATLKREREQKPVLTFLFLVLNGCWNTQRNLRNHREEKDRHSQHFYFYFLLLFSMLSLSLNRIISVFQTSFLSLSIFPLVPVCSLLTGDSVGGQTEVHSPATGLPDELRPTEHAQLLYIEQSAH